MERFFSTERLELVAVIPGSTVTYTMDGANSAIGGSGGCNSYFGSYEDLTETEFTIAGPIGSTMMSCGSDLDSQEYNYLSNLSGVLHWKVEGQTLELRDSDSKVVVVYQYLQTSVSSPSDAIFAKTSKPAKSKSTKTHKMFPKSGKGSDAKAMKVEESDWESSAVPAFAKSSKMKKSSKTKPTPDEPLHENDEEAGSVATTMPTSAGESEIHEQEDLPVTKPEVSETTGEEITHSSTTTEATAAAEASDELHHHPQNPKWFSTSDPEFVALTQFHDENDVMASQHAESALFCYRVGMFLCAHDVICPNGEGEAPFGGGPPRAGSYDSLSATQWVPFYRPTTNPNPLKDDQLSQKEGTQWAQIGAVPESSGVSAEDSFGLCWDYDSFGLFSESAIDDVWDETTRGWILCCSDPAEGELEHMEEVLTSPVTETASDLESAQPVTWFNTDDSEYRTLAETNVELHPHTIAGLFCYQKDLFLCRLVDICPEGRNAIDNLFAFHPVQWAPYFTDDISSSEMDSQWVQISDTEMEVCITHDKEGDIVDDWGGESRKFIPCCPKESKQEKRLRGEV